MKLSGKAMKAWLELPEKEKKFFCTSVLKEEPLRFKEWMDAAGIASGFRPVTIARREAKTVQLDKAFFEVRGGAFAHYRVSNFFERVYTELKENLLEQKRQTKSDSQVTRDELLQEFRNINSDNPFLELFCETTAWNISDCVDCTKETQEDVENREDAGGLRDEAGDLDIENLFKGLSDLPRVIEPELQKLALGRPTNLEFLLETLNKGYRSGELLRSMVSEAAARAGVATDVWNSAEEFWKLTEEIKERESTRLVLDRLSEFYGGLVQLLSNCRILHKSHVTRKRWEGLKDLACDELNQSIVSERFTELPGSGSRSPLEWVEWAFALADGALDGLIASLDASQSALAQLICEVERHHLEFSAWQPSGCEIPGEVVLSPPGHKDEDPVVPEPVEVVVTPETPALHQLAVVANALDHPCLINVAAEAAEEDSRTYETAVSRREVPPEGAVLSEPIVVADPEATSKISTSADPLITGQCGYVGTLWQLLKEERLSLAYHISLALERMGVETVTAVPSEIIKGLILSPFVSSQYGEMAEAVTACRANISRLLANELNSGHNSVGLNLLAFGISLRPALLARQTNFSELLLELHPNSSLPALDDLRKAIINYTHIGIDLNPTILKGMREHVAWEHNLRSHLEHCKLARENNRHASIIYAPTTNVWRAWQDPDQPFGRLLEHVINNRQEEVEHVRSGIKQWSNQGFIREQVTRTDQDLRGRNAKLRPIEARALNSIVSRTLETLELMKEWIDLIGNASVGYSDKEQKRAESCRIDLLKHLRTATTQVDAFIASQSETMVQGAAYCLKRALADLTTLFDPHCAEYVSRIPHEYALHGSLLLICGIEFDEKWAPLNCSNEHLLQELVKQVEVPRQQLDISDVFKLHCQNGNMLSAKRLLDYLRTSETCSRELLENLEDEYEAAESKFRNRLDNQVRNVRKEALKALHYNIITSQDYEEIRVSIDVLDTGTLLLYMYSGYVLDGIMRRIDESKEKRIRIVLEGLQKDREILQKYPAACDRIIDNLERGDFAIAEEHISLLKKGRDLPQRANREDSFSRYVTETADVIFGWLKERRNLADVTGIIRSKLAEGPIDATSLSDSDTESSDMMLKSWDQLKIRGGDFLSHLRNVVKGLGFEVERDDFKVPRDFNFRDKKNRFCWVEVKTRAVEGRDKCPIPSYASEAKGRYQFLCCWDLGAESEIFDQYRVRTINQPTLVLSFGRATVQQRRDFAKLCLEKKPRRSQLYIDEVLAVFSACQPRYRRLNTLFQFTFPFTIAEPYKTTASHVPQEMFYGRQKAREEILKPAGTNLVFGGRQLGKTALLRDVADREHHPKIGFIVLWIDLKTEHIGFTRKAKEIWSVITEKLHEAGVVPSAQATRPDTIKTNILKWLREDESRRVLLLLDEADAFLKFDREDKDEQFANLLHLKGLMEESGRRFKVVFAGLHNVQRTAKDINTPLAHLGSPICIGPLLDDGEIDEAIELIRVPFETLGYRFESEDLVWTILWHTISYPSLIQLFCKHLLEYMVDRNRDQLTTKKAPPYVIKAQHIDNVFQEKGLREAILEKFRLTLDLDQRYRLIALLIASECTRNVKRGAPIQEEFDVFWVRKEALHLWPQGFKDDQSHEAFRTILEEMIGLGILRRADGNKFSLRNLGVVKLLGTEQEIENELYDIMELDGPVEYNEVLTFRRVLNGRKLSPLTFSQENDIFKLENGTVVLFGSRISGLDTIEEFLADASRKQKFEYLKLQAEDLLDFKAKVQLLISQDSKNCDNVARLVVVGTDTPWDANWIDNIVVEVNKRRKQWTRILFLADSTKCWAWSKCDGGVKDKLAMAGTISVSLRPFTKDAIKLCLDSMNLAIGIEQSFTRIQRVTGNWLVLLQRFIDKIEDSGETWRDQLEKFGADLAPESLLELFDLRPEALPAFAEMAESTEPLSVEDLCILTGADEAAVRGVLSWAEAMNLVTQAKEKWSVDLLCVTAIKGAAS